VLKGFEAGTDDYLPKPFDLDIFLARLNGLLRRREWLRKETEVRRSADVFEVNGRTIDFENLELSNGDEITHLTLMEMKLLRYLIEHEGQAVSRKTILEDVWDLQEDTDTRAIDNFIVRLRKYLEDEPNNPKILRTVRGIGYKFIRDEKGE
jgi:DNA-binding response OmpR family regulator